MYANVPGISSNYKLDLSNNSLAAADYVDASPAKSYFGINVTRTFYNSDGFGLYQSQYGTYLMYGSIADYYHNNYAKNPESERGLLDIFSGLGAPVSPITKQADGSLQMEFEGGTLTSKNGTVTPSYSHKGSDRFDLVGQGAPNKDELQWKADYSWFDSRFEHNHVGQPTGSVRRLANGWVQEFTGNTTGAGDSVFLLKDGQTAIGGTERYVNDRGQSIEVPKGGPYRIHGGILDLYRLTGGYESTTSQLGFPTQSLERYDYKGYKVYQAFEKGFIGITASGTRISHKQ